MDSSLFYLITYSLILDFILGDPHSKWHPVAVFGWCSQIFEKKFRLWFPNEFAAGGFACVILCIIPPLL